MATKAATSTGRRLVGSFSQVFPGAAGRFGVMIEERKVYLLFASLFYDRPRI
jgi:hypothetical protein